jgi:hypothetical protein
MLRHAVVASGLWRGDRDGLWQFGPSWVVTLGAKRRPACTGGGAPRHLVSAARLSGWPAVDALTPRSWASWSSMPDTTSTPRAATMLPNISAPSGPRKGRQVAAAMVGAVGGSLRQPGLLDW